MPKEKGPEWNYVTVLADGGDKGLAYALCTFTLVYKRLLSFFRINVFINVYYNFLTFITSMICYRPSVCLSVRHTGGAVKTGSS